MLNIGGGCGRRPSGFWVLLVPWVPLSQKSSSSRVIDAWLARVVEHCYQEGERLYKVRLGILGLQRLLQLSGPLLRGTWSSLRAWQSLMPVRSRVPMSKYITQAVLLVCLARGFRETGTSRLRWWSAMMGCWLAFEGLLRPGETCNLLVGDLTFPELGWAEEAAVGLVLAIRKPKTRRVWRTQFVLIKDSALIAWLSWWVTGREPHRLFMRVPRREWAKLVGRALEELDMHTKNFTLGSLRGGGATHMFRVTENITKLQYHGRWARQETVKSYLQEALSTQVLASASALARNQLAMVHQHAHYLRAPPPFALKSLVAE